MAKKKASARKTRSRDAENWRGKTIEMLGELAGLQSEKIEALEMRCTNLANDIEDLQAELTAVREDLDDLRKSLKRGGRA